MKSLIVFGGDARQESLNSIFLSMGYKSRHVNSTCDITQICIKKDDVIILPVPTSRDGEHIFSSNKNFEMRLSYLMSLMGNDNILFGGSINEKIAVFLSERGIKYFDFLKDENFLNYNAHLTGIGAVRLLNDHAENQAKNKKLLITGYGRVGYHLAREMKKAGTDVYIAARNPLKLDDARKLGYKTIQIKELSNELNNFDYIFNTVPFNIFTKEALKQFGGKYFELASAPYGVSKEIFALKQNRFILGAGLPGKYFPLSSARLIAKFVTEHLKTTKGGSL